MSARVPEGEPVLPVEVRIAAEHLLEHVLDLVEEALREAGAFARPPVGILLHLARARERWRRREVVGWEDAPVGHFAGDPGLDVLDVDRSWEVDWVALGVDPGVGCSERNVSSATQFGPGEDSRSGGHRRACLVVARRDASAAVLLLDAHEHTSQEAVLLDDCSTVLVIIRC